MSNFFTIGNLTKAIKKPRLALSIILSHLIYLLKLPKSASQFGEDLILDYLIGDKKGFYVDIGSNDHYFGNNTYYFFSKGWEGICVEPNKNLYSRINKFRKKNININAAVGSGDELTFYEMDIHGMSTCDPAIVNYYISQGHKVVNQYTVPVLTLENIFDTYLGGKSIDLLSVDVEGLDMDVLSSNNWEKYKPKFIILETLIYKSDNEPGTKDSERFTKYLRDFGYEPIVDTYVNTIYKLVK